MKMNWKTCLALCGLVIVAGCSAPDKQAKAGETIVQPGASAPDPGKTTTAIEESGKVTKIEGKDTMVPDQAGEAGKTPPPATTKDNAATNASPSPTDTGGKSSAQADPAATEATPSSGPAAVSPSGVSPSGESPSASSAGTPSASAPAPPSAGAATRSARTTPPKPATKVNLPKAENVNPNEIGLPVYPASTALKGAPGATRVKTPRGTIYSMMRESKDSPAKIIAFYQSRLQGAKVEGPTGDKGISTTFLRGKTASGQDAMIAVTTSKGVNRVNISVTKK